MVSAPSSLSYWKTTPEFNKVEEIADDKYAFSSKDVTEFLNLFIFAKNTETFTLKLGFNIFTASTPKDFLNQLKVRYTTSSECVDCTYTIEGSDEVKKMLTFLKEHAKFSEKVAPIFAGLFKQFPTG